jgi:hypothetical protein
MFKGLPKQQQLRVLKRGGIVSISGLAVRSISLGAILVALWITLPRFISEVERVCRDNFSWKSPLFVDSSLLILVSTSLGVVLAAVLSTLLQSRGAFGWKLLTKRRRHARGVGVVSSYLIALVLVGIIATALSTLTLGDSLGLLRAINVPQAVSGYAAVLALTGKVLVVGAVVCAILGAILTRFFFLVKNRTRSARGAD